jgi:hypothetical protein
MERLSCDHLLDSLARSENFQHLRPEFNMILITMRSTVGPVKKTHIFSSIDVLVLLDTIMQSKPSVFLCIRSWLRLEPRGPILIAYFCVNSIQCHGKFLANLETLVHHFKGTVHSIGVLHDHDQIERCVWNTMPCWKQPRPTPPPTPSLAQFPATTPNLASAPLVTHLDPRQH